VATSDRDKRSFENSDNGVFPLFPKILQCPFSNLAAFCQQHHQSRLTSNNNPEEWDMRARFLTYNALLHDASNRRKFAAGPIGRIMDQVDGDLPIR
jgi:hypothetical protein